MNYHAGPRYQRGHGIGSLLSGLFRGFMPMVKSVVKSPVLRNVGKQALNIGRDAAVDIAADIIEGKSPAETANERLDLARRSVAQTLRDVSHPPKRGRGKRKHPTSGKVKPYSTSAYKRRRRQKVDIFDEDSE